MQNFKNVVINKFKSMNKHHKLHIKVHAVGNLAKQEILLHAEACTIVMALSYQAIEFHYMSHTAPA